MNDMISRKQLLDHLDDCLSESDGQTPIVDAVLTTIKCAVEQMPTAVDNFCSSCKWREWAATHMNEIEEENNG